MVSDTEHRIALFIDFENLVTNTGISPATFDVPPSTRAGKNGADMRLVIDALELCYAREHIDTFAIASGDSDFCPLAYKLRENNRVLIGLGVREATSPLFVKACDEFIYLKPPGKAKAPAVEGDAPGRPARKPRAPRAGSEIPP